MAPLCPRNIIILMETKLKIQYIENISIFLLMSAFVVYLRRGGLLKIYYENKCMEEYQKKIERKEEENGEDVHICYGQKQKKNCGETRL